MADRATIEARIATYMRTFNNSDREGYVGNFAADATLEDPVGSEVRHGHDGIGDFYDMTAELTGGEAVMEGSGPIRVAGSEAAFPFTITTPAGVLPVIDVMTFDDDGQITSMRAYWDLADMAPVED